MSTDLLRCLTNHRVIIINLAVDSTHTAVGRFRLLVRRSGSRSLMSSEITHVVLTVLNSFLRQSSSVSTNVTSALETVFEKMMYAI